MKDIIIETERLVLKSPSNIVSAEEVLKAINYSDTLKYLSSAPKNYTMESAGRFLCHLGRTMDSPDILELGAFYRPTGEYIGMISLENMDSAERSCELGYWISQPFTGKGLAFEGCTELVSFAFHILGMKRIDAFVIKEHKKSIALLERLGFTQMELLRNNEENDGVLVDRYKYSLMNKC